MCIELGVGKKRRQLRTKRETEGMGENKNAVWRTRAIEAPTEGDKH